MAESTPTVHGICDERFLAVKQKFQENLASGRELGASICVNINGTNVVDLWGGYANESKTKAWEENTITNIWSTSKNATNLAALLLIDRGLLDPDEKVSKYWPEFAANGKENVLVRHLMTHSSGLSGWEEKMTVEDIYDVAKSTKLLEQQRPWWEPGTQSGYHSLTMGHPIGHLVQLLTGQTLAAFIASDLALPLDADYRLGAPDADWPRTADIIPPPPMDFSAAFSNDFANPSSIPFKTFANPFLDARLANSPAWRRAHIGAANAFSNARGVVRILSPVSLGGVVDGTRYLSQTTLDRVFTPQLHSVDLVIGKKIRFGLGFGISSETEDTEFPAGMPRGKVATWGGWGGSLAVMDAGRGVTVGYVMNKMENTPTDGSVERGWEYVALVYKALGVEV